MPARELAPALGAIRALARRLARRLTRGVLQRVTHGPNAQLGVSRCARTTSCLAIGCAHSGQRRVDPLVAPSSRPMSCAQQVRLRPPHPASDETPSLGAGGRGRPPRRSPRRRGVRGSGRGHPRAFDGALHRSRDGGGCAHERGLCVGSARLDEDGGPAAHGELDAADRAVPSALVRDVQDADRGALDVRREPAEPASQESTSARAEALGQVDSAQADSKRRL